MKTQTAFAILGLAFSSKSGPGKPVLHIALFNFATSVAKFTTQLASEFRSKFQ